MDLLYRIGGLSGTERGEIMGADYSNVNYGNLPKNSMETIDKLVGLIKK